VVDDKKGSDNDSNEPKYKVRQKKEVTEYKWAFGQKIPISQNWKLKEERRNS